MLERKNLNKIGIIGYGVVGKAIEKTMSKEYSISIYDKFLPEYSNFSVLLDCKYIFISVPTPFDSDKCEVDHTAVESSLLSLQENNFKGTVLVKSTLPPGTIDAYSSYISLKLCYNPEFLRESKSPNEDFANQSIVVLGTTSEQIFEDCTNIYKKVLPKYTEYFRTSFVEAEIIKYSQNTTLASRVAIANTIFDLCSDFGVNYNFIRKIAFDGFEILGPHMVEVPGPDGRRGFGGKCLPKDIMGFSSVHNSPLIREIIRYNSTLRNDIPKNNE